MTFSLKYCKLYKNYKQKSYHLLPSHLSYSSLKYEKHLKTHAIYMMKLWPRAHCYLKCCSRMHYDGLVQARGFDHEETGGGTSGYRGKETCKGSEGQTHYV